MAQKYYKKFTATGVINSLVLDSAGLSSTDTDKKVLTAVLVNVSGHIGNDVELWLERERLAQVPDYFLDTDEDAGGTVAPKSAVKIARLPIALAIPVGQTVYAGIRCVGTAKDLRGAYEYEIAGR